MHTNELDDEKKPLSNRSEKKKKNFSLARSGVLQFKTNYRAKPVRDSFENKKIFPNTKCKEGKKGGIGHWHPLALKLRDTTPPHPSLCAPRSLTSKDTLWPLSASLNEVRSGKFRRPDFDLCWTFIECVGTTYGVHGVLLLGLSPRVIDRRIVMNRVFLQGACYPGTAWRYCAHTGYRTIDKPFDVVALIDSPDWLFGLIFSFLFIDDLEETSWEKCFSVRSIIRDSLMLRIIRDEPVLFLKIARAVLGAI